METIMDMQYWQNNETNQVYGFDISDASQVQALNELISTGTWTNITDNWPPAITSPTADQNKGQAIFLLSQTDWVNEPDVYDANNTPHLLNRQDFLNFRVQVRVIAVTPVAGNLDWPTLPVAQWSS
jgi:hypothetical protein